MPGLGEKIYNKITNTNQLIHDDIDLQESWKAMAFYFSEIAKKTHSSDFLCLLNASEFCKAMADEVGQSNKIDNNTVDLMKGAKAFDKALEFLFTETDKSTPLIPTPLKITPEFSLNDTDALGIPDDSSYPQKIENNHNKYNNLIQDTNNAIQAGDNLIKGLKGLQTYIKKGLADDSSYNDLKNDLDKKIKRAEKEVEKEKKQLPHKINSIRRFYLTYFRDSLDNSHRWFKKNSTEYTDMFDSAQELFKRWDASDAGERKSLLEAAQTAADAYITRKKGNNTDNNWTPITKEGKKRFALAKKLLDTTTALMKEDLTPPDKMNPIEDYEITYPTALMKEDLTPPDKENPIEDYEITFPNYNIIKDNNNDIIKDNNNDIIKDNNNDIIENENEDDISEKNKDGIMMKEARALLEKYSSERKGLGSDNSKVSEEEAALVAKAVAVNVLKQVGIDLESTPEEMFTQDNIDNVAAAVKKLHPSKDNMIELKQKVTTIDGAKFTIMKPNDIDDIIKSKDFINSINKQKNKFRSPEAGPAKITSPQQEQEQDKNINDNKSIDNKSTGNKSTGKKL